MITAKLKHLRMSPRKVRLVANFIKGMETEKAKVQLKFLPKRAAKPILKLLNSAIANAEHNFNLSKENLYISRIMVDPGPSLKRSLPRAMGRATPILKRTSHITIILDEKLKTFKREKPIKKVEKRDEKIETKIETKEEKEKEKSEVKQPKKKRLKVKRAEKVILQKRGFKDIAKKIFRRKSI